MHFSPARSPSAPRLVTIAVTIAFLSIAGCSSTSTSTASPGTSTTTAPSAPTTPQKATTTITIKNFDFGAPIAVAVGATVTVRNADTTAHTVTAADGSFDTNPVFAGTMKTFTAPTQPGTYQFHCNIHANMHGTLIVVGSPGD